MAAAAPARLTELVNLPPPLTAGPSDPPVHHVRAALDRRLRALLRHDPGTRTGADIEDLHQMRVAVRRMRATLAAARPLLDPEWADGLRAELGWLGRGLGPVRDLDVLLLRLRAEIAGLPEPEQDPGAVLIGALETERAAARERMLGVLHAPRYSTLLERLADAIRLPLPTPSATRAQPDLLDLPRTELRKLRRDARRAGDDPPDEVLHALRIRAKRVRYTGELVEPALTGAAGRRVGKLVTAAAALQEVLGDHQDACVAERRVRELLDGMGAVVDARVVFVAGRLVERERARADAKRGEWSIALAQVETRGKDL
jgi:CHAD domain-containing protein